VSETAKTGGAPVSPPKAITPEMTVEATMREWPAAVEVMKALGINHCCGAHLPLDQAAAAAGVPLATLLRALEDAARVPA